MYQKIVNKFFLKNREPKIKSLSHEKIYSLSTVSISFPFSTTVTVRVKPSEREMAKKTIIQLVNRRILIAGECCPTCSQQSIDSMKEIKSDLIQIEKDLFDSINGSLFYFIDSIINSINQFLFYIEKNNFLYNFIENREIYLEGFNIIRNHIIQCLYQISKIADYKIDKDLYAVKMNKESWDYLNSSDDHKDGKVDILI